MSKEYQELVEIFGPGALRPGTKLPTPEPIFPRYPYKPGDCVPGAKFEGNTAKDEN